MTAAKTLVEKMAEVMAEVGYVQKDAVNKGIGYKYASAEAVLKKVNAALSERGIAVSSAATLENFSPGRAVVKLALTFHDGTDSLTVEGLGEGTDKGDKSTMKANTSALKYAMANAFLISWGDDPEADLPAEEDSPAFVSWLGEVANLEQESRATVAAWWPSVSAKVKKQCGTADAAKVYDAFKAVLASKPEVADEG